MTKDSKHKDLKKIKSEKKVMDYKEKERIKNEVELKKEEQRRKIYALNKLMTVLESEHKI